MPPPDRSGARFAGGPPVRIDGERLWAALGALGSIGSYPDPATGLMGVNRLALTDADGAARRRVMAWMAAAGLAVTVDEIGNIFGRREGSEPALAPVMTGSHIDSVATAGRFDGCLGVLGALEVIRAMGDRPIRRPVVVAVWTEEEGVRFGTDMLGSAVAAGRIDVADAHALVDRDGTRLVDELVRLGFDGSRPAAIAEPPAAYVELHIEQGPVLERAGRPLGVVTGVQAISWQEVTVHGRAAHAGTTPTEIRVDAAVAAAELVVHLRRLVDSGRYGQLRATVGALRLHPGLTNVVAERADLTVDLRNPDDDAMAAAEAEVADHLRRAAERHAGLRIEARTTARTSAVGFDADMQNRIEAAIGRLGVPPVRLVSGAGHDAQEIAAIAPTAMIFVRGQYDGVSHNPREFSTPEDCVAGVTVLADVLLELADR
ncbi:MAG: M20 family metallo-hydrolase [Acidimicrobiales bacterium]